MQSEKKIVAFHKKRIRDIDLGLLDHLGRDFAKKLRRQSEYIISRPCYGYAPEE